MSSVSGINAAQDIKPYENGTTPTASEVSAPKQQDLATEATISVMKLMMNQEKAMSQGILDMLV